MCAPIWKKTVLLKNWWSAKHYHFYRSGRRHINGYYTHFRHHHRSCLNFINRIKNCRQHNIKPTTPFHIPGFISPNSLKILKRSARTITQLKIRYKISLLLGNQNKYLQKLKIGSGPNPLSSLMLNFVCYNYSK